MVLNSRLGPGGGGDLLACLELSNPRLGPGGGGDTPAWLDPSNPRLGPGGGGDILTDTLTLSWVCQILA